MENPNERRRRPGASDQPAAGQPLQPRRKRVLHVQITPSTLLAMVLVVAGVWMLDRLLPVILVLVTSLMIVGTLGPAVEWLEGRGVRRGASIALVFSALLLIAGLLMALTVPALVDQVNSLIELEPALRERLADFFAGSRLTASLADALRNVHYDALLKSSAASVLAFSTRVVEVFAYAMGAIFLALYMMLDRDRLRGALFAVVPRSHHVRLSRVLVNLETIVGGYIRGQAITCALIAVFMFILLTASGVPNALAIAVFGGIADLLPYIGIFLTMAPAVVAAFTVGPVTALVVFLLMLAYEEFESRVLVPMVYGRALRLPSSVVLFSLIAGATLMGVIGALLALPVAAAIVMLIEELRVDLPGQTEQVEDAELRKADERGEREYQRRTEGLPADEAAAIAVEMTDDRRKAEADGPPERPAG